MKRHNREHERASHETRRMITDRTGLRPALKSLQASFCGLKHQDEVIREFSKAGADKLEVVSASWSLYCTGALATQGKSVAAVLHNRGRGKILEYHCGGVQHMIITNK